MAVVNRNTSIEFVVRPKQDLYLEGTLRKLPRVVKGEQYPCQMQKNQNFSCLFRHYAKHNGLRKDDLIFSFVDELQADQTPETVHLMPQDEIWVEHRNSKEEGSSKDATSPAVSAYSDQFLSLLETGVHADLTFIVGEDKVEIPAHRAILSARSQYFQAMLREEGMLESLEGVVRTMHEPGVFRRMLEFIYTNTVRGVETLPSHEVIALIVLANEYLLDDLRKLAEKAATKIISQENIGRLLLLSAGHNASALREACAEFVRDNKVMLAQDANFRQDIELNPELGLLLFESSLPRLPVIEGEDSVSSTAAVAGNKRRRIADQNSENEQETQTLPQTLPHTLPPQAMPALPQNLTLPQAQAQAQHMQAHIDAHVQVHGTGVGAGGHAHHHGAAHHAHAHAAQAAPQYPAGGIMGTIATTTTQPANTNNTIG